MKGKKERLFVAIPERLREPLEQLVQKTGRTRGAEVSRMIEKACKRNGIETHVKS